MCLITPKPKLLFYNKTVLGPCITNLFLVVGLCEKNEQPEMDRATDYFEGSHVSLASGDYSGTK